MKKVISNGLIYLFLISLFVGLLIGKNIGERERRERERKHNNTVTEKTIDKVV